MKIEMLFVGFLMKNSKNLSTNQSFISKFSIRKIHSSYDRAMSSDFYF